MKHTVLASVAAFALATAAHAQTTETETAPAADATALAEETVAETVIPVEEVVPEDLAGANVLGVDGDGIGRVTNIVFTALGEVEAAVVSTGGFLGFGRHSVAIPVTDLSVVERSDQPGALFVKLPLTQDELKAMPEIGDEATEPATE